VREILENTRNAVLTQPDCVDDLVAGIVALTADESLAQRLGAASLADSRNFTWSARAHKIVGILASKLTSPPTACGPWGRTQSRVWLEQSQRWAIHLIRRRSWVLPPRAAIVPTANREGASHATPGQSREGCVACDARVDPQGATLVQPERAGRAQEVGPGPTLSGRMPAQEEDPSQQQRGTR
jgi:hypothetical protein